MHIIIIIIIMIIIIIIIIATSIIIINIDPGKPAAEDTLSRPCPSLDNRLIFSARDKAKSSHSTLHTALFALRT